MFERFTDRARRTLVLAQEEARGLGHPFIGTEHILLGLLAEGEGVAAKVLVSKGLSLPEIRQLVEQTIGRGRPEDAVEKAPFTPRAKQVLEFSLREALQLGHNYIGTEHLLLGLLREGEGVGGQVLIALGVSFEEVRAGVLETLQGMTAPTKRRTPGTVSRPRTAGAEKALAVAETLVQTGPVTTGHLLVAVAMDEESQAAAALRRIGIGIDDLTSAVAETPLDGTSDEDPRKREVELRIGDRRITFTDPNLLRRLRDLSEDSLKQLLDRIVDRPKEPAAPDLPPSAPAAQPAAAKRATVKKAAPKKAAVKKAAPKKAAPKRRG